MDGSISSNNFGTPPGYRRTFLKFMVLSGLAGLGHSSASYASCNAPSVAFAMPFNDVSANLAMDTSVYLLGTDFSNGGAHSDLNWLRSVPEFSEIYPELSKLFSCVPSQENWDMAYINMLSNAVNTFPSNYSLMVSAFDWVCSESGNPLPYLSKMHYPNGMAAKLSELFPTRFKWAASVHPARKDFKALVTKAKKEGALAVRWWPELQHINLKAKSSLRAYAVLRDLDIPLFCNMADVGYSRLANEQFFNVFHLRGALDAGVRVIVEGASNPRLISNLDLDTGWAGYSVPQVPVWEAFLTLMQDPQYVGLLFASLAGLGTETAIPIMSQLVGLTEWHGRLVYGSGYPFFSYGALNSPYLMAKAGMAPIELAREVAEISKTNPLAADFILKRGLAIKNGGHPFGTDPIFKPNVFETSPLFG